jgi:TetR/AcrR family transcriptional regulator
MCQHSGVPAEDVITESVRDERIDRITRTAIGVFARQGFQRTSMADLAVAAGMSRPALYQYFENRAEVFRAAMGAVIQASADRALAALERDGELVDRLEGYLQAAFGDPHEQLATAAFGDEIVDAKHQFAADLAEAIIAERRRGLERHLRRASGRRGGALRSVVDLIELAPLGLKADNPSPEAYRVRLRALAASAATLIARS